MAVDFAAWLAKSAKTINFLIETSAIRLSDTAIIPCYFASRGGVWNEAAYLGCAIDLPRLARRANDTLSADYRPTWGELTLARDDRKNPDAYNTLSWQALLSPDYNFRGRPLVIKMGDPAWAYADFQPIFAGFIDTLNWQDDQAVFTLYDKFRELENTMLGDLVLPESPHVAEPSWGATVPAVLGMVHNYQPVLISTNETGDFPWRYALAEGAIDYLTSVYLDNAPQNWEGPKPPQVHSSGGIITLPDPPGTTQMELVPKDVLPAEKDAEGAATVQVAGPYTGDLTRAAWVLRLASITAPNEDGESGAEVGLARFDWYLNGALQAEGLLTWKLAPGETTKDPALGTAAMALGGEYLGEVKRPYKIKVVQEGRIGGSQTPQVAVSEDDGGSYGAAIDILDTDPVDIGRGLTAAFTGATGNISEVTLTGSGSGEVAASGDYTGDVSRVYQIKIISVASGLIHYRWSNNGGASWSDEFTSSGPSPTPIYLEYGVSFEFLDADTSYNADDIYEFTARPPFVVDDAWSFNFVEIPIPLADGVTVQWTGGEGDDFAVGDEFRFHLGSTLYTKNLGEGVCLTVDAQGLISPVDGVYHDQAADLIQDIIISWLGWTADDFDAAALAAFNAAIPYEMGLLIDSPISVADAIQKLLSGIPALYTMNLAGRLTLAELTRPSGEPVLTLTSGKIRERGGEDKDDIFRRVYLNYQKNHNVESQPAGAPGQERIEFLRREYRQVSRRDDSVRAAYPLAKDMEPLDTCLIQRADTVAAADKTLAIWQAKQSREEGITDCRGFTLELGQVVEVDGNLYRCLGSQLDLLGENSTLDLWR